MFDLRGKKALITGASGGIGMAIARTLHMAGATVVLSGTRRDVLEKNAEELGERAFVVVANLSKEERGEDGSVRFIQEVQEKLDGLDILVNNAGVRRDSLFLRLKNEEWSSVLDVNLTVPFELIRASLRTMIKKRYGRIINISSVVATVGNPGQANYVAAKAGLIGMTKTLASEVASRNITANCVCPGFVMTAMTETMTDSQKAAFCDTIPMGREGKTEEIAAAVLYLASEEAGYVTGQSLHVNGGLVMV